MVNLHETSTGVLYDIAMISEFCKQNNLFLLVDAISSFLADPFDMEKLGVGAMLVSSQKVLACPPGVSIIVLSTQAQERVSRNQVQSLYFDLKIALEDGKRGQTPYTPAVGILLQLHAKMQKILLPGGAKEEIKRIRIIAQDFRDRIQNLPFEMVSKNMSNAMTAIHPQNISAYRVFEILSKEYGIWVCPNGGKLKEEIIRIGHIGDLSLADNTRLLIALQDMTSKGYLYY